MEVNAIRKKLNLKLPIWNDTQSRIENILYLLRHSMKSCLYLLYSNILVNDM